jgi:hypothetical protein
LKRTGGRFAWVDRQSVAVFLGSIANQVAAFFFRSPISGFILEPIANH